MLKERKLNLGLGRGVRGSGFIEREETKHRTSEGVGQLFELDECKCKSSEWGPFISPPLPFQVLNFVSIPFK